MIDNADILKAKILIVDDTEANVRLLEGMLRVAGYVSVQYTTDPTAVCDLHRLHRYDLILLDLQMPGMDGFQVMDCLREIEADGYLPVLVVTAQPGHKLRALEAGAKDFVSKPFELAELQARVHNILEVRLLHLEARNYGRILEEAIRELEASREVVRLKIAEENRQMQHELAETQAAQRSLLPAELPRFENFAINAYNKATPQLGANFYDCLRLSSAECLGVMADVSGKGMPAALLSSMVLGALSIEFRAATPPHEVLDRLNRLLFEKSLPLQFVTLFLFLLKPDGTGQYISAGHNPGCLFRAATGTIEELVSDEYMLGMFAFASYRTRALDLEMGDILVLYSDGLVDAESPEREKFGMERLLEILQREGPSGGTAVRHQLLESVEMFTEGKPQADDITFVMVEKTR